MKRAVIFFVAVILLSAGCRSASPVPQSGVDADCAVLHAVGHTNQHKRGMHMSDNELRERIGEQAYRVIRENGTEPAFRNAYWDNKNPGIYVDVISGEPLFSSLDKFDSGTGWPSFTRPVDASSLKNLSDNSHGMVRVEVRSSGSDAHLGHLFDDGPGPEGQRYCINSASLRFIAFEDLEKEGYGDYARLFGGVQGAATQGQESPASAQATFAAGCFWGVEAQFEQIPGVLDAVSGYTGGTVPNPTYEQVCTGRTGHAEAVLVTYDPALVAYETLLDYFWRMHDPTTLNRQGPDVGSQYRSAVFYHGAAQEKAAKESVKALSERGVFSAPIVTLLLPAGEFFPAEAYHQDYFRKTGRGCHVLRTF